MNKNKLEKRIRRYSGFTLIEVMLGALIMLVILGMTFFAFFFTRSNYNMLDSRVTARQAVLKAANLIQRDVRNSAYVFPDREVRINDVELETNRIDEESKDMILAVPEGVTGGPETYTVVAYYLYKDDSDPVNTNANNLARMEIKNVSPLVSGTPSTIDLGTLTGGSRKLVAKYIVKDKFSFVIRDNGTSVDINPIATHKNIPNQKPIEVEIFSSVNLRNK